MEDAHKIFRDPANLALLRQLNRTIYDLELAIRAELTRQESELTARLNHEKETFLSDFEIEVKLDFYLKENLEDTSETEDDELIQLSMDSWLTPEILGSPDNWNEVRNGRHILSGEHFCYTMNKLIWTVDELRGEEFIKKIPLIDMIWADINLVLQRRVLVNSQRKRFVSAKPEFRTWGKTLPALKSRNILVLDHALGVLRKDLEDAGLKVIALERSKVVGRERNDLLHGRIFVTNQSHDYRDDADMMNFDIIAADKLTEIDAGSLAQMIVKAIATHNLWMIQQTYLLHLEHTGLHELEYL